jgi:hypothetical protein
MAEDGIRMKSDKALDSDINKTATFAELQEILHRAVERSPELGMTRDPISGQFVAREKEAPTAAAKIAADAAPRTFEMKGVVISGKSFDFSAPSELELARQIASANEVAAALVSDAAVTPRSARAAAARNAEQDALDKVDADMALRRGEISTVEYLERTHAIEDALMARGVDIDSGPASQNKQAWSEASEIFRDTVGADWPGGERNRAILGDKLVALGLLDATDTVSALAQAYEALKAAGTLFDGDYSQKQVEAMTDKATPQEIIQAWKSSVQKDVHGDATEANSAFIKNFGGSSSVFDR